MTGEEIDMTEGTRDTRTGVQQVLFLWTTLTGIDQGRGPDSLPEAEHVRYLQLVLFLAGFGQSGLNPAQML